MRIERIILKNYRQFRQAEIIFRKRRDTDLHFIIGTNGTGKTNILNSINWCLYGDEPHLSKDSQQLPPINLKTIEKMGLDRECEVSVEVRTETEDKMPITFIRKAKFSKLSNGTIERQGESFEVRYIDENGNTKSEKDLEDTIAWRERFVPEGIREFFFFDGERLDHYFKEATGQKIRHAVFQISQIDLLENYIERKLQDTLNEFRKEAGRSNPKIEEVRSKLEQFQIIREDEKSRLETCETQIAIAKSKIREYEEKLKMVPEIQFLEEERKKIDIRLKETKNHHKFKQTEKNNFIFENAIVIMLLPAIKKVSMLIEKKTESKEIPPLIDKMVLENILNSGLCTICGRELDNISRNKVKELLQSMTTSSDVAYCLVQMINPLLRYQETANLFLEKNNSFSREIFGYENTLDDIEKRKIEIDAQMVGYDAELIREWYIERNKYESIRDNNLISLGNLQKDKQIKDNECEALQKTLDDELSKEIKIEGIKKKITFCEKALQIAQTTRDKIMIETRKKIEIETRRQFFNLLWKKETFGNIKINEDYSIDLIHAMGYECLGSVSAGEREMLALSFTLALHKASGFDSPILIDTPVARISDENRKNFANVLCEVSTTKQTLLLFTPDEYSDNIKRILHGRASGRYTLKLTSDEKEAVLEAI